jgi:hypothetical protein
MTVATTAFFDSLPCCFQLCGNEAEQLVAVDDAAVLVAHHDAVSIAIERDADVGAIAVHRLDHGARVGGADFAVDVEAVGIIADGEDLGAQFIERLGRDLVGGAVGAIDHDAQAREAQLAREGGFDDLDIARLGVVHALGAAKIRRGGEALVERMSHQLFDGEFGLVRQLVAVGSEQLDAVVLIGVVRGGDHHAKISAQAAREHGDAGRRQRAEQDDVHPLGGEAGRERGFQHVAGQAGILADDDKVPARVGFAEMGGGRHAEAHRHFGRDRPGVGRAANAVRAENLASRHRSSLIHAQPAVPGGG